MSSELVLFTQSFNFEGYDGETWVEVFGALPYGWRFISGSAALPEITVQAVYPELQPGDVEQKFGVICTPQAGNSTVIVYVVAEKSSKILTKTIDLPAVTSVAPGP